MSINCVARPNNTRKYKPVPEHLLTGTKLHEDNPVCPELREAMTKISKKLRGRVMFYYLGYEKIGIRVPESNYLHAYLSVIRGVVQNGEDKTVYVVKSFRIHTEKAADYSIFGYGGDTYNLRYSTNLNRVLSILYKLEPVTIAEEVGNSVSSAHPVGEAKMAKHDKALSETAEKFVRSIAPSYHEPDKKADLIKFVSTVIDSADMGVAPILSESNPVVSAFREFVNKRREATETIDHLGERVCIHVLNMAGRLYLAVRGDNLHTHFVEVPRLEGLPEVVQRHIHTVNTIDDHDCDAGFLVEGDGYRPDTFADDHYALFINKEELGDVVDQVTSRGTRYADR